MIASPEHSGSVARALRQERAYSKAVLEGSLVFLDAQATLDRLLLNGQPDRELFNTVIGEALTGVQARAGHTGIRAYGEMVGLLWKAGQREAAVRLEALWNGLLRSSSISLLPPCNTSRMRSDSWRRPAPTCSAPNSNYRF